MRLSSHSHLLARSWSVTTALLAICLVSPAVADDVIAQAASPDSTLSVKVYVNPEGKLSYGIERKGQAVIAPSRLGFILAASPKLDGQFALESQETSSHDDTWEQPWGERRYVRNRYNELRVNVVQKAYDNRRMTVVFRLFEDGVGFRYEFPEQVQLKNVRIVDEQTEFTVADTATAWWNLGGEWNNLEYAYNQTPLKEVGQANTPLTVKTDKGIYISFHEAALTDFASMWLRRTDGQTLKARLTPASNGPSVERVAPFPSPWRTLVITDNAPALYNSDLILNLNEPNKLGDVSWFKPSKYVGIWWEMHLEKSTWAQGLKHGATTANTKAYIDFAAKNGFRGVLVEGWNKGWDGQWYGSGKDFSFVESYPDFDLKAASAYGLKKGVHLIGHHETGGNIARYESQMENAFKLYAANGVDSVKTGYVTDGGAAQFPTPGGGTHYGFTDSQEGSRHYTRVLETAAKYKIAINSHEPIKDTGLRRTYPNWVSREGARGQEYNAWGNPVNAPDHEANLVFTRMLSGPMDFTPGVLSLEGNKREILSTQAKQLALYVVLYSPIQMAADLPENYARYPKPFQFIKDVPVDWSESSMVAGEVGDYAVIARKDRHSEDWYLGGISDDQWRSVDVPLSFLDSAKSYTAQIYRDGDKANSKGPARFDIVIESKTVTAKDVLSLKMAPGGGTAIRFVPKK